MRKLLTGAMAATATLAIAGASLAQGGGATQAQADNVTFTAKVTPTKAGKKNKPKNTALNFNMAVDRPGTTVEFIDLTLPKGLKFSGKGLGDCTPDDLTFESPAACAADAAGPTGSASASLGAQGAPLTFTVQPFVQDANSLVFYVASEAGTGISVESPITGEITGGGRKMRITIPLALRQPVPGVDASLTGLNQTFNAKKGKRYVVSNRGGCKGGKYKFGAKLTFSERADGAPVPPPVSSTTTARCSK